MAVPSAVKGLRGKVKPTVTVGEAPVPTAKQDRRGYHKQYYEKHRPTILKRRKTYYKQNRETRLDYQRRYNAQLRADALAFRASQGKGRKSRSAGS